MGLNNYELVYNLLILSQLIIFPTWKWGDVTGLVATISIIPLACDILYKSSS
jgi:hypothetical protein